MNFNEEMEKFFKGYLRNDRREVESSLPYKAAAKNEDLVLAQTIACEILEGAGRTKRQARNDRDAKSGKRLFDSFLED
jgi:hypothetical protein